MHTFLRSIVVQFIVTILIILSVTAAYAAYTSLTAGQIATGQPVDNALMQLIKDNLDDLNARVSSVSSIPAGAVIAFNLGACPAGWVAANGANGTPDLRGEFIRGLDSGRGVDSGRGLGTWQMGSLVMNVASGTDPRVFSLNGNGNIKTNLGYDQAQTISTNKYNWSQVSGAQGTSWGVGAVDGNYVGATRPRNVALLYCQKQ